MPGTDTNVLELLQQMKTEQDALRAQMLMSERLRESSLPLDTQRALKKAFKDVAFDLDKLEDAIAEAEKSLKESAKPETLPAKRSEDDVAPNLSRLQAGIEVKPRQDRWIVLQEGNLIANCATQDEAEAVADLQLSQTNKTRQTAIEAIEERWEHRVKLAECTVMLKEKLMDSGLPPKAQQKLEKQFKGQVFSEAALEEAINDYWDVIGPLGTNGDGEVYLPGQERLRAKIIESEFDKLCTAFDGFWAGEDQKGKDGSAVKRFRSLQEAYERMMGKRWDPLRVMREMQVPIEGGKYDSHGRYGAQADGRLTEAISTTTWAQMMGDSITRRVLAEYRIPELQLWRQLTSEISTINDFRLQRRLRFGGYGVLPVVPEGISYTPLPTPDDEESTYRLVKRGGLETITMEAMANDDIQVIRRIPQRLGRAAAQTLFRGFFDMLDQNIALAFDGDTTSVFTTGHANLAVNNPLNADGLDAAIQLLGGQTAYGNSVELLGLTPRFLIHPRQLWRAAGKLTETTRGEPFTTDNDANLFQRFGMVPVQIPYWTNGNRWYLIADPRDVPTFEVGFFRGNEDPEIFVSDQENVSGSAMMDADKITYKIRHIWGLSILDYRGFVASTSASSLTI